VKKYIGNDPQRFTALGGVFMTIYGVGFSQKESINSKTAVSTLPCQCRHQQNYRVVDNESLDPVELIQNRNEGATDKSTDDGLPGLTKVAGLSFLMISQA
jgi:hypothetical protein